MLTVGGLFSGIGGWELGLERAGMRVLWHCEAEPFCQRVLAARFPGDPIYDDVRELRGASVEPVDVLCGGFPCQDLSYAGLGAGINGARSGLWSEYARLVGELRPRYVLVENVAALLARGLGVVLADLAALGYDAEWDCIPASAVGAPHQRDRIWLVAYPRGEQHEGSRAPVGGSGSEGLPQAAADPAPMQRPALVGNEPDRDHARAGTVADADGGERQPGTGELGQGRRVEPRDGGGAARAMADAASVGGAAPRAQGGESQRADRPGGSGECGEADWWSAEPDVGRVAYGIPSRVDRLRSLGNALVPQIAEWIGRRIVEWEMTR